MIRSIPEIFAKRAINYLLRRFFGQYLETFTHEELSLSFNKGTGVVENVSLKVEALNTLCKEYNLPFEFLRGSIDTILVEIPWSAPFTESSIIDFKGVHLIVQPKKCLEDMSMISSMWESMTSSLQLAEDCLLQKVDNDPELEASEPAESVEVMTKAFNTILSKMKLRFSNAVIRVESVFEDSNSGVSLEVHIKSAEIFDEAGSDTAYGGDNDASQPSSYCIKTCMLNGIDLYTAQFAVTPDPMTQMFSHVPSQVLAGSPEMPPMHSTLPIHKTEDSDLQTEPILISRISGTQQINLRLKQNDSVIGPKVDISVNLGLVNLFLTPYQVHMLIELAHGLAKPGSEHSMSDKFAKTASNRPMDTDDIAFVKKELQKHRHKQQMSSKSLRNCTGWSSQSLDESDDDFHILPDPRIVPEMQAASDLESSYSSSVGSERYSLSGSPGSYEGGISRKLSKGKGPSLQNLLLDTSLELSRVRVSCSSLFAVILHEDIAESLNADISSNCKTSKNFAFVKSRAEKFFLNLSLLATEGLNFKDFVALRDKLSSLCSSNHLRFMASGVTFEGVQKLASLQKVFNAAISMSDLEVLECVYDTPINDNGTPTTSFTEIVSFLHNTSNLSFADTCFKLKYERYNCGGVQRMVKPPTHKLLLDLAPVSFEIDISLMDRIRSLLNSSSSHIDVMANKLDKTAIPLESLTLDNHSASFSQKTEVQIKSSFAVVNLRFPIPDLRPLHNMERLPWWKQNVRQETLVMELSDASLSFALDSDQPQQEYILQSRSVHGLMRMAPNEELVSFIRVSVDPEVEKAAQDSGFDWPRLVIQQRIPPETMNSLGDYYASTKEVPELESISDILMKNIIGKEPSPFCSNSLFCGTKLRAYDDLLDENDEYDIITEDDQIIRPADKEKLEEFIDQTISKSQYTFNFKLPTVNIVLHDKRFFEIVVNRLFNDLVQWENVPLSGLYNQESNIFKSIAPIVDLNPLKSVEFSFYPPNQESNSGSEDENEDLIYYSFNDYRLKQQQMQLHNKAVENKALTKIAIMMTIEKGSLLIHTPILDDDEKEIPNALGKLQLFVEECRFFVASSYKGDPNQSYVCLQSNRGSLYHNSCVVPVAEKQVVQPYVRTPFPNSKLIIYQSEQGVPSSQGFKVGCGSDSLDILSLAVHSVIDPKQQVKTIKMALGFCGTTLRHYMSQSSHLFLNQFINFLKYKDEPVKGYVPSPVVVELHLHLSNCTVDYRPLYLPLKTVLTVENFSLSTNITSSKSSSLLRVISEEMRLFLSNDMSTQKVDLKKGYVCVIDTGLIDLSVRVTEVEGEEEPKFEMCASNNMIHIRTCADSCQALQKLIVYLAYDGDFMPPKPILKQEVKVPKPESFKNEPQIPEPTSSNLENVQNLMVEAMKECSPNQNYSAKYHASSDEDSDEGFCILEDDLGVGLLPENREPQIRLFTSDPIQIVDNHFAVPSGKSDLLKAPKHFPKAILCHTLREMSITWHLYGGNDFKIKTPEKQVTIGGKDTKDGFRDYAYDEASNVTLSPDGIAFCKVTPLTREFNVNAIHYSMEHFADKDAGKEARGWISQGGENRDHKVLIELHMNKVSFQHEEYPKDSEYASRDILMIHDIEIRDKLTTSMINKFLYQYSSESMPRQTHANMVVIKSVNVRPDPKHDSQECSLKVSCKPLRLHIDQDALMFLYDFFKEFFQDKTDEIPYASSPVLEKKFSVSPTTDSAKINSGFVHSPTSPTAGQSKSNSNPTFFRSFTFYPEVYIKVDYNGKRVLMEQGALQGILLGLGQLNRSEIRLKQINYRHGLLGLERLLTYILNEWLNDIRNNQLPSILQGIGPLHSFVQLFQGLRNLIWLPIEQYRKDGQIVRGLQRGASSFGSLTTTACLELTTLLIGAIQGAAEVAYDMVSPGPSVTRRLQSSTRGGGRQLSQPADMIEGVTTAYNVVKEGLGDTARNIARVAAVEHEHKGLQGAVGGVLRQLPPAAIKPLIVGAEAACIVLDGVKHQLVPDTHKEAMDKWRTKNI